MPLLDDIISWAITELPSWHIETVRRLLTQVALTSQDHEELYKLFKKSQGLLEVDLESLGTKPLTREGILGASGKKQAVILKKIQEIKQVNAIPDNSELSFAHSGLTVVYGKNGAGKSGYARILKRACFARDEKEKILGNVFRMFSAVPAEANFKLDVDDRESYVKWVDDREKPEILANICVFDSKCARIIIDGKNTVSYLPYGADVFQKLANIFQKFSANMELEKPKLVKPEITDLPETTGAGKYYSSLNVKTEEEDLARWFKWDEEDESTLNKLRLSYAKTFAGDTTRVIQTSGNLKGRVSAFKEKLSECISLFSSKGIETINQLIETKTTSEKAYELASKKLNGPLSGIGTNEWQALYLASKEYSTKHAYPEEVFPATGSDRKCVLCMQALSDIASERLNAFHEYMENSTKRMLDDTNAKLVVAMDKVRAIELHKFRTDFKDVLDEIESRDTQIGKAVDECFCRLVNIREGLIKAGSEKTKYTGAGSDFDVRKIESVARAFDMEIRVLQKNSKPGEIEKLKTELTDLKARKQFSKNEKTIRGYLASLQKLDLYKKAFSHLNTRGITKKGKELVGKALTPQLQRALASELGCLGVRYIPLNLKHSGTAGRNEHQLKIAGQVGGAGVKLTEILSEGEQHVIAIAGFLAELTLRNSTAPIVFDDPVSSLDHRFSERIAARLVQEAGKRQVIVFTHDISFLVDLQSKSVSQEQYCHCVTVCRQGNDAGVVREGEPWHAMEVNKRLNLLDQWVPEIALLYETNPEQYNKKAGMLYSHLRETWEAAIEECLFNKVVRRFQPEIKTLSLREVVVEKSDCDTIDEGMTKCSKWMFGHDLSKQISDDRPAPIELQEDIRKLRDFVSTLKTRRKANNSIRKIATPNIG